jgi:hypothetical protein
MNLVSRPVAVFVLEHMKRGHIRSQDSVLWFVILSCYDVAQLTHHKRNPKAYYDQYQLSLVECDVQRIVDDIEIGNRTEIIRAFLHSFQELIELSPHQEGSPLNSISDMTDLEILFNRFLRATDIMLPNLGIHESYYDIDSKGYRNMMSLDALQRLLQDQQLQNIIFLLQSELQSFFEQIDAIIDNQIQEYMIIVRHDMNYKHRFHTCPLFIRIQHKEMIIIALDSIGTPYDSLGKIGKLPVYSSGGLFDTAGFKFVENIANLINVNNDFQHSVKLYTQKSQRQSDMVSCSIMTIEDVLTFKNFDFITFISTLHMQEKIHLLNEQESLVKNKTCPVYVFNELPLVLMKTMQTHEELFHFKHSVMKSSTSTTKENMALCNHLHRFVFHFPTEHTLEEEPLFFNFFCRYRFFTLSRRLILERLEESTSNLSLMLT